MAVDGAQNPALYDECDKCGGAGMWTPPSAAQGNMTVNFGPRSCPDCDGVGAIATPEGAQIIDLIRRWRNGGQLI